MSVALRVELPSYSHSFIVQVPDSSTILDVKQEIFRTCIGAPRVEGQRIIWRGRYLANHESVEDLWKSPDEPRIVHLAVHPSAWSSNPPTTPQPRQTFVPSPQFVLTPAQTPRQFVNSAPTQPANPSPSPINAMSFINFKHQSALLALLQGRVTNASISPDYELYRSLAVQVVERNGWSWPAILDENFPAATEGGLKYERINIDGQWYLSLSNWSQPPTALQIHALKVLTYTFTLISLPIPNSIVPPIVPVQPTTPANVNLLLQQLGIPQLRVAQNPNQNPNQNAPGPDLPELAMRPLLVTLLMLGFRTLLLLYFVAPARKPVFGFLILAWMIYEVWQPVRNFFFRDWRRAVAEDFARQNGPARPVPVVNPAHQGPQRPPAMRPGGIATNRIDAQATALLDDLANINILTEEQAIAPSAGITPEEPSLAHKAMTFVSLLAMTVHPAIWNRRRVALRQREVRIRAEANAREPQAEGEDGAQNENREQIRGELVAQYARRPRWVRDYMERVVAGDWADDSD